MLNTRIGDIQAENMMGIAGTPRGIGVDIVNIREVERLDLEAEGFSQRLFTEREQAEASSRGQGRASYLAGRFAMKEAVFKAVAHLTPECTFDLRIVETLSAPDGSPQIQMTPAFTSVCSKAGVSAVLASISNEGDLAVAFAIAVTAV